MVIAFFPFFFSYVVRIPKMKFTKKSLKSPHFAQSFVHFEMALFKTNPDLIMRDLKYNVFDYFLRYPLTKFKSFSNHSVDYASFYLTQEIIIYCFFCKLNIKKTTSHIMILSRKYYVPNTQTHKCKEIRGTYEAVYIAQCP
jgi:hypothetical protein